MTLKVTALEEACEKITDGTHHSPPIVDEGIPYVTAKHIKSDGIRFFDNPWYVSKESHDEIYSRCDPQLGDVLYIKDGATTGIAAVNRYDFPFSMLSSVALLRPKAKICDSNYLCRWLNAPHTLDSNLRQMGGAAIKRLTLAKIKKFKIPLPPLDEQKRIADILNKADALRSKRREALQELDTLLQATFLDMFGDPVTNPKGWDVAPLGSLVESTKIGMVRSSKLFGPDFPIPYIRMDAVSADGQFLPEKVQFTEATKGEIEEYGLCKGDFLFNTRNSKELVGKTCVYNGPSGWTYNNNLMRIRFAPALLSCVVAIQFQLPFVQRELEKRKSGTTSVYAVYWRELQSLPLQVPSMDLQSNFAAIAQQIEGQKAHHRAHLTELDSLFAALQQRAFAGQL